MVGVRIKGNIIIKLVGDRQTGSEKSFLIIRTDLPETVGAATEAIRSGGFNNKKALIEPMS